MKCVRLFAFLGLICCAGCHSEIEQIERDLEKLPDEWGHWPGNAAATNNFAILKRAQGVANVQERIRLVRLVRDHFWHEPMWYVTNCVKYDLGNVRIRFLDACSCQGEGLGTGPELLLADWRLTAEFLDLIEGVCRLTEMWYKDEYRHPKYEHYARDKIKTGERTVDGNAWEKDWNDYLLWRNGRLEKWNVAWSWRRYYGLQFWASFSLVRDYRIIPPEYRPAFVKQIQRDFFQRPGMAYVDWDAIPEDFKKGIEVPPAVKAAREKKKDAKSPTGNVK